MNRKKIGIIGATGYTGSELTRILLNHPGAEIAVITSESRAGERFSDVHPFFRNIVDMPLESADHIDKYDLDLVFLALPHGVSMDFVKKFQNKRFKVIDLSGDFRLSSPETYESWYKKEHTYPEGFEKVAYGIPELFSDEIKNARLVANPGCYPTCSILGAAPLLSAGKVKPGQLIVDAKSGVTGAGGKAKPVTHFSNVNENFKAYGLRYHRHTIEIQEILGRVAGTGTTVQFTPHLLPVDRGILSTIYLQPEDKTDEKELGEIYREFYGSKEFIRMCDAPPAIKDVRGTNYCDIHVTADDRTGLIIVLSAIDNLVRGAAGQAIQNMNIMLGLEESAGLNQIPVSP